MTFQDYQVRIANPNDKTQIFDMWYYHCEDDEPLMSSLLSDCSENSDNNADKEHYIRDFEEYQINCVSVVAVQDEKIIGFAMNKLLEQGEENTMYTENENYNDYKYPDAVEKMHVFLDYVGTKCDFASHFPDCGKVLLLDPIYVDPVYRGKGICTKLIQETRKVAKDNGCNYIKIVATSLYTSVVLEKLGFEKLYSIDYKDYKVNGEVVFKIEPPHTSLAVYFQKVNDRG